MKVFFYSCPRYLQSCWASMLGINVLLLILLCFSIRETLRFLKKGEKKKKLVFFQVPLLLLTVFSFCPSPINQSDFALIGKNKSSRNNYLSLEEKNSLKKKLEERKTWHAYSRTEHEKKYNTCKYVCGSVLADGLVLLFCVSQVLLIILANLKHRVKLFRAFLIYYVVISVVFLFFTALKTAAGLFLMMHPYKSLYKMPASRLKGAIDTAHFRRFLMENN